MEALAQKPADIGNNIHCAGNGDNREMWNKKRTLENAEIDINPTRIEKKIRPHPSGPKSTNMQGILSGTCARKLYGDYETLGSSIVNHLAPGETFRPLEGDTTPKASSTCQCYNYNLVRAPWRCVCPYADIAPGMPRRTMLDRMDAKYYGLAMDFGGFDGHIGLALQRGKGFPKIVARSLDGPWTMREEDWAGMGLSDLSEYDEGRHVIRQPVTEPPSVECWKHYQVDPVELTKKLEDYIEEGVYESDCDWYLFEECGHQESEQSSTSESDVVDWMGEDFENYHYSAFLDLEFICNRRSPSIISEEYYPLEESTVNSGNTERVQRTLREASQRINHQLQVR